MTSIKLISFWNFSLREINSKEVKERESWKNEFTK